VFVAQENMVCTLKWPSLIAKTEEKSLVGLTPEQVSIFRRKTVFLIKWFFYISGFQPFLVHGTLYVGLKNIGDTLTWPKMIIFDILCRFKFWRHP
jgi:hypothetical protein